MPAKSTQSTHKKKPTGEGEGANPYSPSSWIATPEDSRTIRGAIVGRLASLGETGEPFVDFPGNTFGAVLSARSTLPLNNNHVGREVLLIFEEDDLERPIVIGLMEEPESSKCNEERIVFTAEHEIVLRCGAASITLDRSGRVQIKGSYILSRSSGTHRIKGGSVLIN